MKTRIIVATLVLAAVCLVSCDGNLIGTMGKMGGNVYGLSADTGKADKVSEKMDEAVGYSEDKAEIDWDKAASAASEIVGMTDSPQLKEKLTENMKQPVSENAEEAAKVSEAMKEKLEDIKKAIDENVLSDDTLPANISSAVESVSTALETIRESIGNNPTKADLATVAVVSNLADNSVKAAKIFQEMGESSSEGDVRKAEEEIRNIAIDTLDSITVLKTITGSLSYIGASLEEIDISTLVSSEKDLKPEDMGEDDGKNTNKIFDAILPVLARIKVLMEENHEFSAQAAAKLAGNMQAIRSAYEVYANMMFGYTATTPEGAAEQALQLIKGEMTYRPYVQDMAGNSGLTFDDIVYYALSTIVAENKNLEDLYARLSEFVNRGGDVKTVFGPVIMLDGTDSAQEMTFYTTAAVLIDASGWSETIRTLAKENLTAANVLKIFHEVKEDR